jgi:hypothetical protein
MLLSVIFSITAIINAIVYIYIKAKDFSIIQKNQIFKRAFQSGVSLGKEIENTVKEGKTKSEKTGRLIGAIFAVVIFLFFASLHLIIPIILSFNFGFIEAISAYMILVLLFLGIQVYAERTRPLYKIDTKKDLLRSILFVFYFQLLVIILFGFNPQLDRILGQIYLSDFLLKNTFTFLMPTLFLASIVYSLYFYWIGLLFNSKSKTNINAQIKTTNVVLIFVLSSFIGILYLIESNFSFIDYSSGSPFDRTYNTFIFLLSSILIPLMFNLISDSKISKSLKNHDENIRYSTKELIDKK